MQEYAKIMLDECHLRFEEYRQDKASSVNSETVPRKEVPWVPEVFSRVRQGASFRRPKAEDTSGEAARKNFSRGSLFKT